MTGQAFGTGSRRARRLGLVGGAALVLATALVAAPAAAKPRDWQITPASSQSIIVMRASPRPFSDHVLVFSRAGESSYGGRYALRVKAGETAPFVARAVAPGTYRLNNLIQQRSWSSCFGNGTVAFTVQPGKVYYLGSLNIDALLDDLQQSTIARGRTSLRLSDSFIEWEPRVRPEFGAGSAQDLAALRTFMAATMPTTTAPVEAPVLVPAAFDSGKGKRILQVCG